MGYHPEEPRFTTLVNRMIIWTGKHRITVPYHRASRLPVLPAFANAKKTSEQLAMSCVSKEANQNMSPLSKMLLRWHFKLGHVGFQQLQWIGRQGWLGLQGENWGKSSVECPDCAACNFGKQGRNPKPGVTCTKHNEGALKKNMLNPGDLIFADQYESPALGRVFNARGASLSTKKSCGGTLFYDAASQKISIFNQVGLAAPETIASKLRYEKDAFASGVIIKKYCTDNGIFTSQEFLRELDKKGQGLKLSGV